MKTLSDMGVFMTTIVDNTLQYKGKDFVDFELQIKVIKNNFVVVVMDSEDPDFCTILSDPCASYHLVLSLFKIIMRNLLNSNKYSLILLDDSRKYAILRCKEQIFTGAL